MLSGMSAVGAVGRAEGSLLQVSAREARLWREGDDEKMSCHSEK